MSKYSIWWLAMIAVAVICGTDLFVWLLTGVNIFYAGDNNKLLYLRACLFIIATMNAALLSCDNFHLKKEYRAH